jgi:RNA polymerase sigma-70 factor (ECF subfamily)
MAGSPRDPQQWLGAARAGSSEALGNALEACRRYLLRVAQRELDPQLRSKGSASDLVQQTFLEAQRDFARFQGDSETELLAWLRQILLHNLANFSRSYRATDKRQLDREVALDDGSSSSKPGRQLTSPAPSPSQEAMEHEQAEALERALARLPEEYRQVITLRHQEQRTFEEIGRLIGRSPSGARTLWLRAVERLNQELEASP